MSTKTFAIVGLVATAATASALTSVGPFTSTYSETFSEFPNFKNGGDYSTLAIMGAVNPEGTFTTAMSDMNQLNVYQPSVSEYAGFGMEGGYANTVAGPKGLGLFNMGASPDVTLTFTNAVNYFGGYFADYYDAPAGVTFYDASGTQLGSVQTVSNGGHLLTWDGWYSSDPIKTITFTDGYSTAMGDLQAGDIALATPEPGAFAAIGLGIVGLLLRRRR